MDERTATFLTDLARGDALVGPDLVRAQRRTAWLAEATDADRADFLAALVDHPPSLSPQADQLLAAALAQAIRDGRQVPDVSLVGRLYRHLGEASHARGQLLAWLAARGTDDQLASYVELLLSDPPRDDHDVVQALAPLFRRGRLSAAGQLFPALLDALCHPQLAAPVLDLANFMMRSGAASTHPAADRSPQLIELLGQVGQSLARLEERPDEQLSPTDLSRLVASTVALAVSLCDALALIGDPKAIGKLRQALAIGHRRLRTEAAAALAHLGDETGISELVRLAEEPVARLRVLAYADELGIRQRIDPQFQTPAAEAEAELAVYLAEPTQFGIPPAEIELFDQRTQYWPGYAEPVECFLFRYTYAVTVEGIGERSLSNIGIAGPTTHALLADLADLPPADIYAAYAGWQAEHEEIKEYDVSRLSKSEKLEAERLARRLHDAGHQAIEPQLMGYFFGNRALVAQTELQGIPGIAIADSVDIGFFPMRNARRPLGARECYSIYKGRQLLATFNRPAAEGTA
jgi:hypothetical protein